jgi:xanthine dehydrogenase accessory factor
VGVVRVLDKHGFGTVEPAQMLVANSEGELVGEVYRGSLDSVAVPLATAARTTPGTRTVRVDERMAVAAGLACGGGATLLAHPLPADVAGALGGELAEGRPAALVSTADGLSRGHGFIGALGSRRTQSGRRKRLAEAGVTADEMQRLHGPVGLDLGARTPAETAVSIVAEVLADRAGRAGAALATTDGRIGL